MVKCDIDHLCYPNLLLLLIQRNRKDPVIEKLDGDHIMGVETLNKVELLRALEIAKADNATKLVAKIENLLASKTESLSKQKVWIDSDQAWKIGVTVSSNSNDSGLGGSWFTRKVTDVKQEEEFGFTNTVGMIKLNHKNIKVVLDNSNEWLIA